MKSAYGFHRFTWLQNSELLHLSCSQYGTLLLDYDLFRFWLIFSVMTCACGQHTAELFRFELALHFLLVPQFSDCRIFLTFLLYYSPILHSIITLISLMCWKSNLLLYQIRTYRMGLPPHLITHPSNCHYSSQWCLCNLYLYSMIWSAPEEKTIRCPPCLGRRGEGRFC